MIENELTKQNERDKEAQILDHIYISECMIRFYILSINEGRDIPEFNEKCTLYD